MNPELLMSITAGKALSLDHIPGGARPEWTPEDAALACQGLDRRRYAAFALRWAKDESQRSTVFGCLMTAAADLAISENWPARTSTDARYLEKLVLLAVWEELNSLQAAINLMITRYPAEAAAFIRGREAQELRPYFLAAHAGFPVNVWEHELQRRYEGIRMILQEWCDEARAHIGPQLRSGQYIDASNEAA